MENLIVKSQNATVTSYPRVGNGTLAQGVPSAVTARVWTPVFTPTTSGVAATVDATSETVTAEADEGVKEIATTSGTYVKDRLYLLGNAGVTQVVQSRQSATDTVLRLAHPLLKAVDVGSTIQGFEVSTTLSSAQTAQAGPVSIQWQATVGGVVLSWAQALRIVRFMPRIALMPHEIAKYYPSFLSYMPPTDVTLEDTLVVAWEHRIVPLLEAKGAFVEDVVSDDALKPLHALAVLMHLTIYDQRVSDQLKADMRLEWASLSDSTFRRSSYFERDQQGDPTPLVIGAEPNTRSRMRLVP